MKTTINLYLAKAIAAYPYELQKAVEALNYALSYEPENVKALCLMAKVYSEQFSDPNTAKTYFEAAIAANLDFAEIYPDYINMLLRNDDFEAAQKVIDFAKNVKGADRAGIQLLQGQLFEMVLEFEKAEEAYKEALMLGMNEGFIEYVERELSRATKKRERRNNRQKNSSETASKLEEETKKGWFANRLNNFL
ncbi:MAG: hypothetical protein R2786_01025 [Flavobacteriaceae bacterium]